MAERLYRVTVEVPCPDIEEGGALTTLAGLVSGALHDADLRPRSLHVEEIDGG